jgi:hypothetical protein
MSACYHVHSCVRVSCIPSQTTQAPGGRRRAMMDRRGRLAALHAPAVTAVDHTLYLFGGKVRFQSDRDVPRSSDVYVCFCLHDKEEEHVWRGLTIPQFAGVDKGQSEDGYHTWERCSSDMFALDMRTWTWTAVRARCDA